MRGRALAGAVLALATAGVSASDAIKGACTRHWIAVQEMRRADHGRARSLGVTADEYEGYLREQETLARTALRQALADEKGDEAVAMHRLLIAGDTISDLMERMRRQRTEDPDQRARALAALAEVLEAAETAQDALAGNACDVRHRRTGE